MQDKFFEILNNAKNILVCCYARIGDAAVASILIDNLAFFYKEKNIIVVCSKNNNLIFYGKDNIIPLVWPDYKNIISNYEVDVAIFAGPVECKNNLEIFQFLKKQKHRCVFVGLVKHFIEGYGYDICIYNSFPNIIERCKLNTKIILDEENLIKPSLMVPSDVYQQVINEVKNLKGSKKIYINLSAADKNRIKSYISRTIPLNIYLSVIRLIYKKYKNISLLITAAPWDYYKTENIIRSLHDISENEQLKIITTPTLHHLISIIKISDIVVTPETSVVFIASILDKPIVGIYNSKKKATEWPPFSNKWSIVLPKISFLMLSLDPQEIFVNVEKYLNQQ